MTTDVMTTDEANGEGLQIGADRFDLARHDAVLTLVSPRTGDHRTFRVRTIHNGNLAGKRIVELLNGPDNGSDYEPFGFADGGSVTVWRKYRGEGVAPSQWERFAGLLEDPAYWARRGVEYLVSLK
jgi:hypothetical protein